MTKYYEITGKIDGQIEVLYGSFVRSDCVDELDSERDSWKDEGYKAIKVASRETTDQPDMAVYTNDELATNEDYDND
jgi:hypothetical protein